MSNLNRGRRERDGPHLQVSRRSSLRSSSGIGRLASTSISSPTISSSGVAGTSRFGLMGGLSTSAPDRSDPEPDFPNPRPIIAQRSTSYGSTGHTSRRKSKITSGEALGLATGGVSLRKPSASRLHSSRTTPTPSGFRPVGSHSFLLPTTASPRIYDAPRSGGPADAPGGNKLASTMASLPKPKRTSKTSQKLVVLPSAPQTKPLSNQLVLIDEGQDVSDDGALPQVSLHRRAPPRGIRSGSVPRLSLDQMKAKAHQARIQARVDEEVERSEEEKGREAEDEARPARVREYKSAAERMSKEERKKAGYKRITAYCVAEGIKMKLLAGFLKREHNVHPRIFDEALYAMYHLPLLPGYGPNINVRSSAPPAFSDEPSNDALLAALEETEELGYNDAYFPQELGERDVSGDPTESVPIPTRNYDPHANLPGLVRAPSVEEVKGLDGYVTSGSLPPMEGFAGEHDATLAMNHEYGSYASFTPQYNPYPSSSEDSVSPLVLRSQREQFHHQGAAEESIGHTEADTLLPGSSTRLQLSTTDIGASHNHHSTSHEPPSPDIGISDSGVETDDPGAFTDPGVYGPWPRNPSPNISGADMEDEDKYGWVGGAQSTYFDNRDDGPEDHAHGKATDLSASTRTEIAAHSSPSTAHQSPTEVGSQPLRRTGTGSGGSGSDATAIDKANTPHQSDWRSDAAHGAQAPGAVSHQPEAIAKTISGSSSNLSSDNAEQYGPILSAYEQQLAYEREREQAEFQAEKEREKLRQLEYERALAREREREREKQLDNVAEVMFFDYGVVVFFGMDERGERDVLEDIGEAGVFRRLIPEDEWEVEECHFAHDPNIAYPRIYNDFFTLKSRSHLLKLSIAHALAQSTLLARYETLARRTLSSPMALSIPRQMVESGSLQLRRHEALKLTGRLFKLRRDVNLVSNVLDVPELFWSEASLSELYDAVRDYMEIGPRVESLNEKLGVASDFLDAIHDHLNNNAMERITRIIIWLIVVAILVELGEIVARLIVHSTLSKGGAGGGAVRTSVVRTLFSSVFSGSRGQAPRIVQQLSKTEALDALERMMGSSA